LNILISLLPQFEELREFDWEPRARFVLDRLAVPITEATPGAIGLLLYPTRTWGRFAESAREMKERPEQVLAFATAPLGDEWLAIPDHPGDGEYLAVWHVQESGTLRAVSLDLSRGPAADTDFEETIERLPGLVKESEESYPCETEAPTLACKSRHCKDGECMPYSWFDPRYRRRLYGCRCARP
jgi:hypothetical protein